MRTKSIILTVFLFCLLSCVSVQAQIQENKPGTSRFNLGIRAGVNAISTSFYNTYYNNERIETDSYTNKVGLGGTFFSQIYISPFLIQPEVSWNLYREGVSFKLPDEAGSSLTDYNITLSSQYINLSMLLGYSIINDYPYVFNVIGGVSFRANYLTKFNINHYGDFKDKDMNYNYLGIIGLSFSIARTYFEIRYEFNFPNNYIHFNEIEEAPREIIPISIKKNENIISFSFGFLF